jgi:hypothetical protein
MVLTLETADSQRLFYLLVAEIVILLVADTAGVQKLSPLLFALESAGVQRLCYCYTMRYRLHGVRMSLTGR